MDIANATHNDTNTTDDLETVYFEEEFLKERARQDLIFKTFLELFTVLSLVCIAANLLLCYVIIKYRRLRRNKSNIILMHWTILNTLFMLFSPTSIRISVEYTWLYFDAYEVFCALEQVEMTLLLGNLLLIEMLLVSWFLRLYHPRTCQKFERNIVFFVTAVYVVCAFFIGVYVRSCFYNLFFFRWSDVCLALSYALFIVFMVVMNVVHLVKRRKLVNTANVKSTPLVLANTYFVSVIPLLVTIFLQFDRKLPTEVNIVLVLSSLMLAVLNSIYFIVILYRFDKDYNTFLYHIFTCKCKDYAEDELREEPVVYNGDVQNVRM